MQTLSLNVMYNKVVTLQEHSHITFKTCAKNFDIFVLNASLPSIYIHNL